MFQLTKHDFLNYTKRILTQTFFKAKKKAEVPIVYCFVYHDLVTNVNEMYK